MSGIFISYRREDSGGHAGHLYGDLCDHFGPNEVFMDLDKIPPGEKFTNVIKDKISLCDVLIAVIGKKWLTITDSKDRRKRRLNSPQDLVRREIELALSMKIPVLPVLVQGAAMPRSRDLPDTLAELAEYQACEVSEVRWEYDMAELIEILEQKKKPPKVILREEVCLGFTKEMYRKHYSFFSLAPMTNYNKYVGSLLLTTETLTFTSDEYCFTADLVNILSMELVQKGPRAFIDMTFQNEEGIQNVPLAPRDGAGYLSYQKWNLGGQRALEYIFKCYAEIARTTHKRDPRFG